MSTRSLICKELPNGKFRTIYCHYDGYLEHNGEILCDVYDTAEKVDKLLDLGDLSQLDIKIEPIKELKHTFDDKQKGVCVAYGRDRGDTGVEAREFGSFKELFKAVNDFWAEYVYIFTKGNKWVYTSHAVDEKKLKYSTEQDLKNHFSDLSPAIDQLCHIEDRYGLTEQKLEKITQLEKNIQKELDDFKDNCSKLAPLDVYDLAGDIIVYEGLYRFLREYDERFTEKELDTLNSTNTLLFELNSKHIIHNKAIRYNFDGYRNAVEFYIHETQENQSGEMC